MFQRKENLYHEARAPQNLFAHARQVHITQVILKRRILRLEIWATRCKQTNTRNILPSAYWAISHPKVCLPIIYKWLLTWLRSLPWLITDLTNLLGFDPLLRPVLPSIRSPFVTAGCFLHASRTDHYHPQQHWLLDDSDMQMGTCCRGLRFQLEKRQAEWKSKRRLLPSLT